LGTGNLEQEARDARRAFFARLRREIPLDLVALGHTLSDQAETVLYRLLRGSGTAGLAGMRPVTVDCLIRPLLGLRRDEVRAWAMKEGIPWREDATNSDPRFVRNRLRNEVLPALRTAFNPNLEEVLAGTASVAQAEEDHWEDLVSSTYERIVERSSPGLSLQIGPFMELDCACQRRLVRRAIAEIRGDLRSIDLRHVEAILALCASTEGHDRVIVPGVDAMRSFGTLRLTRPGVWNEDKRHYRVELTTGKAHELPFGLGEILVEIIDIPLQNCGKFEMEQSPSSEIAYIDSDAVRTPLYVRNWEPGDAIRRPDHSGVEKLKTLFQEHKVLLWERRHWPVIVCGDEVVWARHFGCAAGFVATSESRRVLRLTHSV
jgi:tRNA(Ile)-lysidine synthase